MLSGIGTLIGAGAVIYAAHKGSDTFKQWRRQKSEERRIELAEQILTLAYKITRAFEGIRSPAMLSGEMTRVEASLREQLEPDDKRSFGSNLITAQGALLRIDHYKNLWDALLDTMPVAKAVFGNDIETQLSTFWTQRGKIIASAHSYARSAYRGHAPTEEIKEQQLQQLDRLEQVLWSGGDESGVDAFANTVNAAVAALEAPLLLIIRSDTPFGISKTDNRHS